MRLVCLRVQHTNEGGEASSHHVVIEVVIRWKAKSRLASAWYLSALADFVCLLLRHMHRTLPPAVAVQVFQSPL